MAKISVDDFLNFFKYFKEEDHQVKAVETFYNHLSALHGDCLQEDALWIKQYRKQTSESTNIDPTWHITKEQMAEIMGCSASSLPDSLMNDFAYCCDLYGFDLINIAYFLGQCGHESAGLRYPVEIHDGSNYEGRSDLGNIYPLDGVTFAGTGWIQVTGRYNHQAFSDYLQNKGEYDPKIMEVGKTYSSEKYPWSISGYWWFNNNMIDYCKTKPPVDRVGQRVNGRYLPNGYQDRRNYTKKAFTVLGIPYPGN
jgi:predicted chitinase